MNEVNYRTYKAIYGHLRGFEDAEIILPDGVRLVYREGDHGMFRSEGCNHYVGFMRKSDWPEGISRELARKNRQLCVKDFGDLLFLTLDNIKEVDKLPVYTSQEMMDEFELGRYYIVVHKPRRLDDTKVKEMKARYEAMIAQDLDPYSPEDCMNCFSPGEFCSISKIINIEGPYAITLFRVVNRLIGYGQPCFSMQLEQNVSAGMAVPFAYEGWENRTIVKDAHELFEKAKQNVLDKIR